MKVAESLRRVDGGVDGVPTKEAELEKLTKVLDFHFHCEKVWRAPLKSRSVQDPESSLNPAQCGELLRVMPLTFYLLDVRTKVLSEMRKKLPALQQDATCRKVCHTAGEPLLLELTSTLSV